MASTFTAATNTGGAFLCEAGSYAIGRSTVTTAAPTAEVSFAFTVTRRPLVLRVGSAAGTQDIVTEATFGPGDHVYSFVPGISPYYVEWQLRETGEATLEDFARVAPGKLSLPTPWESLDPPALRAEQSLNVQWWCDGLDEPRVLERRGTSSWSLRRFQPEGGPFENDDTSEITLTPSARTGTSIITASGPVFKTVDAGSLIRLTQAGQFETANLNVLNETSDSIRVTGSGIARDLYYIITGTFVGIVTLERSIGNELSWQAAGPGFTAPVSSGLNDTLDGQIVYYRWRMTAYTSGTAVVQLVYSGGITYGVGRINEVTKDNEIEVDVLTPFSTTDPTAIWARGSWSDRFGWPSAVALFDGRLTFLRSGRRWQSASDDFENFAIGADDADAISGSIPGRMNIARWLKAAERLTFGTAGGEGFFTTGSQDDVMTPFTTRARVRTDRGSINADAALVDGGSPAFIHRSGRKVELMVFDGGNSYNLTNLSRFHRDIAGVGEGSLVELAYQTEPEPRLHIVRDDGQCAIQLLDLAEHIGGYSRIIPAGTDAKIESVCVLPGTPEDHVYRVVSRTIGGVTKRYVEKLAPERWTDSSLAWRLESAVEYSGVSATAMTGLDHLNGQEVYAWGNGRISGPYTVASGAITLSYAVTYAIIGLKYQGRYKGPKQAGLTQFSKIERLGMMIHLTPGGGISWGRDFDNMADLDDRTATGAYDSPTELVSEDVSFPINGSWSKDARVCLRFNGVGPGTILGLVPGVATNTR